MRWLARVSSFTFFFRLVEREPTGMASLQKNLRARQRVQAQKGLSPAQVQEAKEQEARQVRSWRESEREREQASAEKTVSPDGCARERLGGVERRVPASLGLPFLSLLSLACPTRACSSSSVYFTRARRRCSSPLSVEAKKKAKVLKAKRATERVKHQ